MAGLDPNQNWLGIAPDDFDLIQRANRVLSRSRGGIAVNDLRDVHPYAKLRMGSLRLETWGAVFFDDRRRFVGFESLFTAPVTSTREQVREMAFQALAYNAHAVVIVHNRSAHDDADFITDLRATSAFWRVLDTIDVEVLDHLIVDPDNGPVISLAKESPLWGQTQYGDFD